MLHPFFLANQITLSRLLIQIQVLNDKQCKSTSFLRSILWHLADLDLHCLSITLWVGAGLLQINLLFSSKIGFIIFLFLEENISCGNHRQCLTEAFPVNTTTYVFVKS